MKSRVRLGKALLLVGTGIWIGLAVTHFYARGHGTLRSFDDGGWPIVLPFIGTISTAAGFFLLALSGPGKR